MTCAKVFLHCGISTSALFGRSVFGLLKLEKLTHRNLKNKKNRRIYGSQYYNICHIIRTHIILTFNTSQLYCLFTQHHYTRPSVFLLHVVKVIYFVAALCVAECRAACLFDCFSCLFFLKWAAGSPSCFEYTMNRREVCVHMCVCVKERERGERKREGEKQIKGNR